MKVIIMDLIDTGARAVVLGDKAFVDVNYLEDFMKYHPDAKIEDINTENVSLAASIWEGSSMKGPKNQVLLIKKNKRMEVVQYEDRTRAQNVHSSGSV